MSQDEVGTVVLPVDRDDPRGVWKALVRITFSDVVARLDEVDQDGRRNAEIWRGVPGSGEVLLTGIVRDEKQLRRLVQRVRSSI